MGEPHQFLSKKKALKKKKKENREQLKTQQRRGISCEKTKEKHIFTY